MSDTPETDAKFGGKSATDAGYWSVLDLCRRMERERDEAIQRRMETVLQCELLEKERDEAREVLLEIANASHFDNIGNWARNKAREALEEAR
jgi:hypothetical protein